MGREEVLSKINAIAKKDSGWMKDAEKRIRQHWWRKHWNKIHLKWLRFKRKLSNL